MNNIVRKLLKTVSSVLIGLIVLLAVLLVGVRLLGLQVFTVLSPSMEPEYPTGALIYVREVDPATLKERDVITFWLSDTVTATHRIIELVPDENDPHIIRYRTQGDANEVADGTLVDAASIIGTPVLTLPYLGYVASFIQQPPGLYLSIAIGLILVILVFMVDFFTAETDDKKHKPKTQEE